MTKSVIKKAIADSCLELKPDNKGYVPDNKQISNNLIYEYENWNEIKEEINSGQGNELKVDRNGLRKFNAVHSSTALCVNSFAFIKEKLDKFTFKQWSSFIEAGFEKKLPTGISTPNLDFYLETNTHIIGIESKYIETIDRKLPNHGGNLEKYINRKQLYYLPTNFESLIKEYIEYKATIYLDVAQLLKHTMGLIKQAGSEKSPVLCYLYWQPVNWQSINSFKKHRRELEIFKSKISKFINFICMSYDSFWKLYDENPNFKYYFRKVKSRYNIEI